MSRGDKDKDVTYSNDPKMVAARVFLGRLPTEQLTKQDIEEIFAKHGKILGISLFKGFGFVQFADEKDALKAIEAENNTILKGSKIGVHSAGERRKRPISPSADGPAAKFDSTGTGGKSQDAGMDRPFDCVIVVTQKRLRPYAEQIERRLLELNLTIDLIFLLQETALDRSLEDMHKRGVLYILVIQPHHEQYRSITIFILHGSPPQEHRNMPLEDAMLLLAKNFNDYLSGLRIGSEQPSMGFLLNLLADGKHLSVNELDRIILHLQDRRDHLIESQGEKVPPRPAGFPTANMPPPLAQQQPPFPLQSAQNSASNAAELQQKIMSILSAGRDNQQSTNSNSPQQQQFSQGTTAVSALDGLNLSSLGNLKNLDTNLKKAIDNLASNPSFLRNFSNSASTSVNSQLPSGSGMTAGMPPVPITSSSMQFGVRPTGPPPPPQVQFGGPVGTAIMNVPLGPNLTVMGGGGNRLNGPVQMPPRPQQFDQSGPFGMPNYLRQMGPPSLHQMPSKGW